MQFSRNIEDSLLLIGARNGLILSVPFSIAATYKLGPPGVLFGMLIGGAISIGISTIHFLLSSAFPKSGNTKSWSTFSRRLAITLSLMMCAVYVAGLFRDGPTG